MYEPDRGAGCGASCLRVFARSRSCSAAAESVPTSSRATARPRADGSGSSACGGGPTVTPGHGPPCRRGESPLTLPGAKIPPTGVTTAPSGDRPVNQATACGGTITSTTSSSRSTTIPARAWPAVAARSLSIWRGRIADRQRDAWHSAAASSDGYWRASDRGHRSTSDLRDGASRRRSRCPPGRGWHLGQSRPESLRSCPSTTARAHCAARSWR